MLLVTFSRFVNENLSFDELPKHGKQHLRSNYQKIQQAIARALELLYAGKQLGGSQFLLEIAMAESLLGTHPSTLRYGRGDRGVFQINKVGFAATKNVQSHPGLVKYHAALRKKGIDWDDIVVDDTNKLVYGALAARLFLLTIAAKIPTTRAARAQYWKKYYNTALGKGTAQLYLQRVEYCYTQLGIDPTTLQPLRATS